MTNNISNKAVPKEEALIVKMATKYFPYWPIFVFLIIIGGVSSYFYLRYSVPKFQANASIIIKDEKKGNEDSKLMESLNMINTKKIIENEIEVLQSRPVIDNVVKNLKLYAPIKENVDIWGHTAYKEAPVFIEHNDPESIKGNSSDILIEYDPNKGSISLDGKVVGKVGEWINSSYGTLRFLQNENFKDENSKNMYFFNLIEIEKVTDNILRNLKVSATNRLSSIINLKYKDLSRVLSEDVLNNIINSYNDASIREKNSLAKNTLSFIEQRLNVVGADLENIEKKIQEYKASSGAVDIGTQGELFLQNVSTNDQKLSEINFQLSVINQLEKNISASNNITGVLPSNLGVIDPTLSQLINNLSNAELEREKLKKTVAENNPLLVSVTDQIIRIKQNIGENIVSQRRSLEASKDNLFQTNSNYNSLLHNIPVKERELLEISRDQSIKSGIYSFLLQKREESELSYASTISDSRVINYAQSSNIPVSPNRLIVLGAAFCLVFAIPITLIGVRETFNASILYRHEIEALTSIPIIGEISYNKDSKALAVESGKRTLTAEEFRRIRYSLLYLGIDSNHKKILVTSSISGEGKSFVAANLAISCSLTGKRVVLVDMDLHNSSLDKIFEKEKNFGVTDYLGGEKSILDIIYDVPKYENLSFIASGTAKNDPSELIENGNIVRLLDYLNKQFDVIIIDTAPIGLVTDAHVLSNMCNTTLYIVRHTYSPKVILKRFDQNNEINPLKNPAIIFNGVKSRGYLKNNYGHGYGYGSSYVTTQKA